MAARITLGIPVPAVIIRASTPSLSVGASTSGDVVSTIARGPPGPPGPPGSVGAASLADLGIWVGSGPPSDPATYAQWLATLTGHFAWLDLSSLNVAQTLQAVAAALSLSPGTPTLSQVNAQTLQAVAAAMLLQAGTPTISQMQAQNLTAAAAQLLLVAGTPTISQARALSAAAGALALTPGTPTLTQTAGGGTLSASDNFNRASLGANWAAISGTIGGSLDGSHTQYVASAGTGDHWATACSTADEYAEILWTSGDPGAGASTGFGPVVRCASAAETFYWASIYKIDDGEGGFFGQGIQVFKMVAGTPTAIGAALDATGFWDGTSSIILRLEAAGTTLTVLTGTVHGSLTSRGTRSDSAIDGITVGGKYVGLYGAGASGVGDNFYGGDV